MENQENSSPQVTFIVLFLFVTSLIFASGVSGYLLGSHRVKSPPRDTRNSIDSSLPFSLSSSAVTSAQVLYLLSGSLERIFPIRTFEPRSSRYDLFLLSPTGERVGKTFSIPANFTNVVISDRAGKETPFSLSQLKRGDQLYLNYSFNLKDRAKSQVTKVIKRLPK